MVTENQVWPTTVATGIETGCRDPGGPCSPTPAELRLTLTGSGQRRTFGLTVPAREKVP
jgi:hypothetical protein